MGLFLKQNEQRSQLQTKIAADLSERLNKQPLEGSGSSNQPQPAFLDNQRATSPLAWVWIIVGIVAIIGTIVVLTPR